MMFSIDFFIFLIFNLHLIIFDEILLNRQRIERLILLRMFEIKFTSRIILDILFIYQLYDIFNDYLHYNYSIELNFDDNSKILPSVTVCIEEKYDLSYRFKNWNNPYGNQTIVCVYTTEEDQIFRECNEEKIYLRYRHKEICLTFFNNKTNNYNRIQNISTLIILTSLNYEQQKVIIHPPDTPSHFEISNVFISKSHQYDNIFIKKVTTYTLQKPFSTDCHDYSQHPISSTSQRSQTYCMFEYMKEKEINKCGENIYWNQYVIDRKNQMFRSKSNKSIECIVQFNHKILSRLCKKDCINEKYTVIHSKNYNPYDNPIAVIPTKIQYNIYLSYKPKLTIEQLCSNLGGLISMYFGLSMIDIAVFIYAKIFNIRWIKVIKIIISIVFKYLIKIVIYLMMLYQLIMIIQSYIEENRRIKIALTNDIKFNKIALAIGIFIDFERNEEYYPRFEEKYYNLKFLNEKYNLVHDHIYNVFLQNITTFIYITRLFDRKIECTIEFENHIKLDCGEIVLSKIMIENSFYLLYNIPADNLINSTEHLTLKQISIKIIIQKYDKSFDFKTSFFIHFYNSIFHDYLPNEFNSLTIHSNYMNNFIVEPNYYRRLTHFGQQCDLRVRPLFDDSLTDDCIINCFQKRSIDEYNCILFEKAFGFIRWEKNIIDNNHNLCNQSYNQEIIINTFIDKCIDECQFDCELGLYKITKFIDHYTLSGDNYIPIKIIPRSNLIVQYEEQYVMDGWELIYQLGGVVGMWKGWSALSVISILNNLFIITNIMKYKLKLLLNISKNLIDKLKIISNLKIYFRTFCRKMKIFFLKLFVYISKCIIDFIENNS